LEDAVSEFCAIHRIPRARVDPIDSARVAWALIATVMRHPPEGEIIALLLDAERRGRSIVVVTGTAEPDAVHDVVDVITERHGDDVDLGAVIIASVRPGADADPDDLDRWLEISGRLEGAGVELLEWFVVGREVSCPRDLLGERPRWGG
jgi:hypothetical protein